MLALVQLVWHMHVVKIIMRDKGKKLLFLCPLIVHNNNCLKLNWYRELFLKMVVSAGYFYGFVP